MNRFRVQTGVVSEGDSRHVRHYGMVRVTTLRTGKVVDIRLPDGHDDELVALTEARDKAREVIASLDPVKTTCGKCDHAAHFGVCICGCRGRLDPLPTKRGSA